MSPSVTSPELARIIEEASGVETESLTPEASISELGISSLAMIEIAVHIEDTFGVRLDDETVLGLDTIGALESHIEANRT